MRALLDHLVRSFDHIVIDSPPALPVSDPILLSTAGGRRDAGRGGQQDPQATDQSRDGALQHAHAKIFGVVLNRVKIHKADYFFPYYKYYGAPAEGLDDKANGAGANPELTHPARAGWRRD